METVFLDAEGIFLMDFLEKSKTITGAYYTSLLDQVDDSKRRVFPSRAQLPCQNYVRIIATEIKTMFTIQSVSNHY